LEAKTINNLGAVKKYKIYHSTTKLEVDFLHFSQGRSPRIPSVWQAGFSLRLMV